MNFNQQLKHDKLSRYHQRNWLKQSQKLSTVVDGTSSGADNIIANDSNCFEYGWIKIEKQNHWKPTSREIEIDKKTNSDKPQAWLQDGEWRYNYLWALEEARACGKKIPSREQWMKFFGAIPWDATAKNAVMNEGKFPGFRDGRIGDIWNRDGVSDWWADDGEDSDDHSPCVYLRRGNKGAYSDSSHRSHGFSLRFLG